MRIRFYVWIIIGFFILVSFIAYPDFAREFLPLGLIIGGLLIRKLLFNYFYRYSQYYNNTTGTGSSGTKGGNYQSGFSGWSQFTTGAGWQGASFGNFGRYSCHQASNQQGGSFGTGGWNASNINQNSGGYQNTSSFYNQFKGWSGFKQGQNILLGKDPYNILGIKKQATMDEIKKAYREKLKKFHPDVVEKLNLDPEYRELFEEKTREIHNAYQLLGGK